MIYPYNDSAMIYDINNHFYVLNSNFVLNEMAIDLIRELKAQDSPIRSKIEERYLSRVSLLIYNFIYSFNQNNSIDYMEYLLAKKPEWRTPIQKALEEQVLFMSVNPDVSQTRGVNLIKGTKLQTKREDAISPIAQDILQNAGILYTGYFEVPFDFYKIIRSDY